MPSSPRFALIGTIAATCVSLIFVGPECGLCVNPGWVVTKRNIK